MEEPRQYERVRVEDRQVALVVYFNDSRVHSDAELEKTGRELLSIVADAADMGRAMLLSFRGVESISSALIGKLVTVNKRARAAGISCRMCDVSPAVAEVFRRSRPGDGPAGVFAVPEPPLKNDSGRACPEYDDEDA